MYTTYSNYAIKCLHFFVIICITYLCKTYRNVTPRGRYIKCAYMKHIQTMLVSNKHTEVYHVPFLEKIVNYKNKYRKSGSIKVLHAYMDRRPLFVHNPGNKPLSV